MLADLDHVTNASVDLNVCSYLQGEGSLPAFKPDITNRARDGCEGTATHPSYQTAQQQVSPLWF